MKDENKEYVEGIKVMLEDQKKFCPHCGKDLAEEPETLGIHVKEEAGVKDKFGGN